MTTWAHSLLAMQGSYEAKKFSLVAVAVEGSLKLEHALPQAMQAQDGSVLERKGWQVEWRKDVAGTLASPLAPPYCIPLGWGMWDVSGVACQLGLSWPDCNAIDPRRGGGGDAAGGMQQHGLNQPGSTSINPSTG